MESDRVNLTILGGDGGEYCRNCIVRGVSFDDERGSVADRQQIADVLARVVARGAEARGAEARLVLRVEAVEVAAFQLKVGGARHVAQTNGRADRRPSPGAARALP